MCSSELRERERERDRERQRWGGEGVSEGYMVKVKLGVIARCSVTVCVWVKSGRLFLYIQI